MNKKAMGFILIILLLIGLIALYFIFKTGLVVDFINFVRGWF